MGDNNAGSRPVKPAAAAAARGTPKKAGASPVATAVAVPASKNMAAGKAKKPAPGTVLSFFSDHVTIDSVEDERAELAAHNRLAKLIKTEALLVAVLSTVLIGALPFLQEPVYRYFAFKGGMDDKSPKELIGLPAPNMTNRAVLSWAAGSITEVMTIGFGDFEKQLLKQKWRFTTEGWDAFVRAFLDQKIGETFRSNQLVLTTVPSDVAVIIEQGEHKEHLYQWKVQMPVVMTYATNNNVTRKEKTIITLTIVRSAESPVGIAIHSWTLGN